MKNSEKTRYYDFSLRENSWFERIEYLLFLFLICAMIGYLYEVLYTLILHGYLANRGTLRGPYLPLYGSGGLMLFFLFYRARRIPPVVFFGSMLVTGGLEYGVGHLLLWITGRRYWSYRGAFLTDPDAFVCLHSVLIFATFGVLLVYAVAPLVYRLTFRLSPKVRKIAFWCIAAILATDALFAVLIPAKGGLVA